MNLTETKAFLLKEFGYAGFTIEGWQRAAAILATALAECMANNQELLAACEAAVDSLLEYDGQASNPMNRDDWTNTEHYQTYVQLVAVIERAKTILTTRKRR